MSKEKERPDIKEKAQKEKDNEVIEEQERSKAHVPEPPECEPQLGDLTPLYIEWVKKYHPDDFKERYKDRLPEDWEEQAKEAHKAQKEREKEEKEK